MPLVLLVALAAAPASAQATVSPTSAWTQFQADARHTGELDGPQAPYTQKWSLAVKPDGQQGLSAPVISDELGLAVAVGKTSVLGVSLNDGTQRFSLPRAAGPPSAPAIAGAGGRPIVLFTEGGSKAAGTKAGTSTTHDSDLRAVDLTTHKAIWGKPVKLAAPCRSGVTVSGGTAFVGDVKGNVTAVDTATGKTLWTHAVEGPRPPLVAAQGHVILATGAAQGAAPSAAPDLVSLDASTGREQWHTTLGTTGTVTSTPAILGDRVVVEFSDSSNSLTSAFALGDGSQLWSSKFFPTPFFQVTSPAASGGDVVAVDGGGDVRRMDADSGATRWDFALNETPTRAPAVSGDAVLLGLSDGTIDAIDASSGLLVWRSPEANGLVGSIAVGRDMFVAVRGGHSAGLVAYASDPGGELLAEHSPTEVRWPALVGWYALAAVIVVAVLYGLARLALGRLGPATFPDDESQMDDDTGEDES
jgi:outer membrane protein assembly factor BamB